MMSNMQYLLTKLAEEGNEVAQMALKNQHFGIDECQFEGGESNRQRLHGEINDLLGVIRLLNEEESFGFTPDEDAIVAKMEKIRHYRAYSVSLGLVKKKWNKTELIEIGRRYYGERDWPRGAVLVRLSVGDEVFRSPEGAKELFEKGLADCYVTFEETFGGNNA